MMMITSKTWGYNHVRSVGSEKSRCGLDVSNSILCSSSGECWTADDAEA